MAFDFVPILENSNRLVIYDYTTPGEVMEDITSFSITITSTKLSSPVVLDVVDYLYNDRETSELYIITADVLGQQGETIPDGLYKIEASINTGNYVKTRYTVLFPNIKDEFNDILEDYNYGFEVSEAGTISYVGDFADSEVEQIRLLSGLMDQLETYEFLQYTAENSTDIDDILTKATRIAKILTN